MLPKKTLGRTGLEVTTLGFGAMELRGKGTGRGPWRGPDLSEEEAGSVLNAVLDAGINFIDTSPDYGISEKRIGQTIPHRRNEYFLASKCGCAVGAPRPSRENGHGTSSQRRMFGPVSNRVFGG